MFLNVRAANQSTKNISGPVAWNASLRARCSEFDYSLARITFASSIPLWADPVGVAFFCKVVLFDAQCHIGALLLPARAMSRPANPIWHLGH